MLNRTYVSKYTFNWVMFTRLNGQRCASFNSNFSSQFQSWNFILTCSWPLSVFFSCLSKRFVFIFMHFLTFNSIFPIDRSTRKKEEEHAPMLTYNCRRPGVTFKSFQFHPETQHLCSGFDHFFLAFPLFVFYIPWSTLKHTFLLLARLKHPSQ